jgi:hypothetical protein
MKNLLRNLLQNHNDLANWVPGEARLSFPTTVSIDSAREQTLAAAREKVIRSMLPPSMAIDDLIRELYGAEVPALDAETARNMFCITSAAGYIVDEKILTAKVERFEDNLFVYRVRLSAKTLLAPPRGDRNLRLDLVLNRTDFTDGDELVITATASHDGYLYLFDFLSDQSVVLMYPLQIVGGPSITANTPMRIPSDGPGEHGHYRVIAARDRDVTVETLYGLFCLHPVEGIEKFFTVEGIRASFSAGAESYHVFQRLLAGIAPSERSERAVQVRIRPARKEFF